MKTIELVGVITGICAVYLLYKNSILTWATGFVNILCFMVIFWNEKLIGDFIVQIIFLIMGIFGWINWSNKTEKNPSKISILHNLLLILITILTWVGIYFYFKNLTNCNFPLAESLILSLSISGQILTVLRKIENWYYWLVADFIMIIVYCLKELYPTALYALIIFIIGIFGLLRWQKLIKRNLKITKP